MRGEMRRVAWGVALLVALGGCRGDGTAERTTETDTAVWGASPGDTAPGSVEVVPRPEQTIATGRLAEINASGVTGAVTVRGIEGGTEIVMNVSSAPAGAEVMEAALVQGPCDALGAEVAAVGPLPVGPGSIAAVTDTVALDPGTVLDGGHSIIVRTPVATPAVPPLACAGLPRWERTLPPA